MRTFNSAISKDMAKIRVKEEQVHALAAGVFSDFREYDEQSVLEALDEIARKCEILSELARANHSILAEVIEKGKAQWQDLAQQTQ